MKTKLGKICSIDWGNTSLTKKSYKEDGKFIAVSAKGCDGRINHYEHEEDVCVLSAIGAQCGKMFFPQEKFTAIKNTITLKPKKELVDSKFLYYLFTSVELPQRGTAQPFISKGDIEKFEIDNLPNVEEQKHIVTKIDAAFAEIDNSIMVIKNKKNIIKMLIKSIFNKELSPAGKIKKINDVCINITDGSHFSPKTVPKGYPYITVRDIINDKINFSKCRFINNKDFNALKKNGCSPEKGDLLFSKDGTVGKVTIVENNNEFVVLSSLAILKCNTSFIAPEYLFLVLKSPQFLFKAVSKKTGVAIKRIILKNLKNIEISLPSLEEQKVIIKKINELMKENKNILDATEKQLNLLEILKISVLKSLTNIDKLAA